MSSTKIKKRKCKRKLANHLELKDQQIVWSNEEVDTLLKLILEKGHMNYEEILKQLPGKDFESYRKFLRVLHDTAIGKKVTPPELNFNLTSWIENCEALNASAGMPYSPGPQEIALVLKLLSIDGALEHHPLPENCNGIDFGSCYRLLYQAVLGHPLQPLNKPTLDLFYEIFHQISKVTLDEHTFSKIKNALPSIGMFDENIENSLKTMYNSDHPHKPVKSYVRKKTNITAAAPSDACPISLSVESVAGTSSQYSLKTDNGEVSLSIPQRIERATLRDEEKDLFNSVIYNPLKFPSGLLKDSDLEISLKVDKALKMTPGTKRRKTKGTNI